MGSRFCTWFQRENRFLNGLIILCALSMLGVFALPLFTGSVYVEDDLGAFNLPMRYFLHQCLQTGDSFLWMPGMFCGFYAHGEGQAGMMHPWHYFLYRFFPFQVGFNLELLVNYPLIFLGMYFLLRRWRISSTGALLGAWLFSGCGFCFMNYLHIMMPSVLAHTPWILLAVDIALKTDRRAIFVWCVGAVTFLTASQLLLGFPQCVYFSCVIEAVYGLLVLSQTRRLFPVFALFVGKCLAVMIAAVQMLPQMATANDSIRRSVTYQFISSGGVHPANILQFFNAYVFNRHGWMENYADLWDAPYFSALIPPLLIWGLLRFSQLLVPKRYLWTLIGLGFFGAWLAIGEYGYIYHLLYFIPWINRLRGPRRHMVLVHFSLACLAAVFFMDLVAQVRRKTTLPQKKLVLLWIPAGISLLIATGATLVYHLSPAHPVSAIIRNHLAPPVNGWFGAAIMTGMAGLVWLVSRGKAWALPCLVLLLTADLSLYGLHHKKGENLEHFLHTIELPPYPLGYRLDPDPRPVTACTLAPINGYNVVSGYAALFPISRLDYSAINALRIAGVGWSKTAPYRSTVLADAYRNGITWWPVPNPLPRVWCVTEEYVSLNPQKDIESINPTTTALVDTPFHLGGEAPGKASIAKDRPGTAWIQVDTRNAKSPQLLIFSERYHRGWKARINGTEVPVYRVNGDFMGCLVEPGGFDVHFSFEPDDYRRGVFLTVTGILLAGGYLLILGFTSYNACFWGYKPSATD